MLPSTDLKASAPRTIVISVLPSPAHPYRYRRFARCLTAPHARLAEERGLVTPSFQGTCTPCLLPVSLAHQIRTCPLRHTAPTLSLTARRFTAICRTRSAAWDTVTRSCVRPVLWPREFLSVAVLRSTSSAEPKGSLFAGFLTTMTASDSLEPCIFGYGWLPSRSGPALCQGGSKASQVPMLCVCACLGSSTPRSPSSPHP